MNKRKSSAIAIYAIVAIAFVVISLLIPIPKSAFFWIMFGFSIFSIAAGLIISYIALAKPKELMSKFYGYPLFRIGYLYTIIQLLITIIAYVVGSFIDVPYWIGLIVSILLVGFAAIGCIVAENARDIIEKIDEKDRQTTKQFTEFKIDISEMLDLCKDDEVKDPLSKLVARFKYSDPVSSPKTAEKEKEIAEALQELKDLLYRGEKQEAIKKIEAISVVLSTRNRMCEAGK